MMNSRLHLTMELSNTEPLFYFIMHLCIIKRLKTENSFITRKS